MTATHISLDPMIEEIVRAVVAAVSPERIILFGSSVRGERGPDSDVDLLVVAEAVGHIASDYVNGSL